MDETPANLDGDLSTLHIRCGSDIRDKLRAAGLTGDFLEQRAKFLESTYGWFKSMNAAELLAGLKEADRRLTEAHHYQRVVFWFEHDSYDQLVLARCLAHFADAPHPVHLELICIDRHPSIARFIGLGQLEAPDLAGLWPTRTAITQSQCELGRSIWAALRRADPSDLAAIVATGTPALPLAAPALRRHLQELPGVVDGLSLTQRLLLGILAREPTRIGRMFEAFQAGLEPLPFLGDIGILGAVEDMEPCGVLTMEPGEKPFPRVASITDLGRRVLAGEIDNLSLGPPERWVGGVIADGTWRWGEDGLVSSPI